MISGFSHATLRVTDLQRSIAFYCDTLGFQLVHKGRLDVYLQSGATWLCLITRPGPSPSPTALGLDHLAFAVDPAHFPFLVAKLTAAEVPVIRPPQPRGDGLSFNFLDPDGIQLELHTGTLAGRLA